MKHNYRTCNIKDCIECSELVDYGIVMACDEYDSPGDSDSDGWTLTDDGRVLCENCYKKELIKTTEQSTQAEHDKAVSA